MRFETKRFIFTFAWKKVFDNVYVDRSASVVSNPELDSLILKTAEANPGKKFGFSNYVWSLDSDTGCARGNWTSIGGGTNVQAVILHAENKRSLVITDGGFLSPHSTLPSNIIVMEIKL